MTHSHFLPTIKLLVNDSRVALAQRVERFCQAEGLKFDGIWCNCDGCRPRLELVRVLVPELQNDSLDTLREACFAYWSVFRRKAGQA